MSPLAYDKNLSSTQETNQQRRRGNDEEAASSSHVHPPSYDQAVSSEEEPFAPADWGAWVIVVAGMTGRLAFCRFLRSCASHSRKEGRFHRKPTHTHRQA